MGHWSAGLARAALLAALACGSDAVAQPDPDAAPAIGPPRLRGGRDDVSHCYPPVSYMQGREGRVYVDITIEPDGSVSGIRIPVGTDKWQEETVRCVVRHLRFEPGTIDGKPVQATARLPIVMGIPGATGAVPRFDAPTIRSSAGAVEEIYRHCYPPGASGIQEPVFKFTVGVDGRARNIKLLQSGGDPRLDEAGRCIVKQLEFRPLLRGSQAVKATVTWPIHVGPSAARPET